ncbi:BspA family leucine-rich repeat surface protein [Peredibacter starrii]|uniref:BspA family leucine-rich repeat surface protein n=1 Tax=Peredibacter starrii TaxID=28202 RepID=A0AAX4HUU6_9BACT|nr:BspA family leucine-rich repeat surface protein [Peredibacter starrii]WPU67161.1 BspA family leucine-rich repeat surface protein [Peredibacter starrii]
MANNIHPGAFAEDSESLITLDYSASGNALATACSLEDLDSVYISTPCSCDLSGICTVGITGVNDFYGAAGFKFTVFVDSMASNTSEASLSITNVNDAPVAGVNVSISGDEDTLLNFNAPAATDVDSDPITYTITAAPLNGVLSNCIASDSDLNCNYTPNANFNGSDSFRYLANDGTENSALETIVTISINAINDPPVLDSISDQMGAVENTAIATIDAGELGLDLDSDSQTLSYSCFYDQIIDGTVAASSNCSGLAGATFTTSTGVFSWTPIIGQAGDYEFSIIGSDGSLSDDEIFRIKVDSAPRPFISIWRTTTASESISLPLRAGFNYNFTVDWGDGSPVSTVTSTFDTDRTHIYAVAGDYTVTINGLVEAWYFNNTGSRAKIIEVTDLGKVGWKNLSNAFYGCSNLVSFAGGDTSLVTDMTSMFRGTSSLTALDVSTFNTSAVTNMSYMFFGVTSLTHLDLSNFNTSLVTNMTYMFTGGSSLVSLNLSGFNTAAVTNMSSMFTSLSSLTSLDLSDFNTVSVTDMSYMFFQSTGLTTLDLSGFDTSAVTTMMSMFQGVTSLTSLNLSGFNTAAVTNMGSMFENASALTSLNLSSFNTSSVVNMGRMFYQASSLTSLDLSNFITSAVTNMASMFQNASSLTSLNLSGFNTAAVTSMGSMFEGASSLTSLNLSSFNTSAVTNMSGMFYQASSLTSLDLANFNTSSVTSMVSMFRNASSLTSLNLSNFNTTAVTSMAYMFYATTNLTSLNANGWNVTNVTNSSNIFTSKNPGLVVSCDQGGTPGTGSLFGEVCN